MREVYTRCENNITQKYKLSKIEHHMGTESSGKSLPGKCLRYFFVLFSYLRALPDEGIYLEKYT